MIFDDSFPGRVAIARSAIGMTQDELAQKVGVVRRQIAAYEGGEARPRIHALQNLAAALGTTTEWLTQGKGTGPDVSSVKRTVTVREIPVLTNVQSNFESLDALLSSASIKDFIPLPLRAGENCFALEISGDSMSSAEGISFPHGSIVTFDSDLEAKNGDYVLGIVDGWKEAMFKQLIIDQGRAYLKTLDPRFPMILADNLEVVGVAIHTQIIINRQMNEQSLTDAEFDRLIAERDKVNKDFWDNPNLTPEAHLDKRLKRLEEIADRLEKIIENDLEQAIKKST